MNHSALPWKNNLDKFEGCHNIFDANGIEIAFTSGRFNEEEEHGNTRLLTAAAKTYHILKEIVGQEKPNRFGYDAAHIALDDTWREKARSVVDEVEGTKYSIVKIEEKEVEQKCSSSLVEL